MNDVEATFRLEGFQDLLITPATPVLDGQSFSVTVEYAGRPGSVLRAGMEAAPWRAGDDEWTVAGEPESSAWWYPANDHPSDPALLDVSVRVPAGYQAISVGRLVSKDTAQEADFDTWRWQTSESLPTYASFLGIGHYELKQEEANGRPFVYAVSTRLSAQDRTRLFTAMERTPSLVQELEAVVGRYPYSEIGGFVPATELWFDGLETATRPVYKAGSLLDERFSEELLVHELAHMWFGNHVTLLQWNDIFVNEAFASWAYWEIVDRRGGRSADAELDATYGRTKDRPEFWQVTMIDPGPAHLFSTVYVRGPMAVQALDNVMGDRGVRRAGEELGPQYRAAQSRGPDGRSAGQDVDGSHGVLPGVAHGSGRSGADRGERVRVTTQARRLSSVRGQESEQSPGTGCRKRSASVRADGQVGHRARCGDEDPALARDCRVYRPDHRMRVTVIGVCGSGS